MSKCVKTLSSELNKTKSSIQLCGISLRIMLNFDTFYFTEFVTARDVTSFYADRKRNIAIQFCDKSVIKYYHNLI